MNRFPALSSVSGSAIASSFRTRLLISVRDVKEAADAAASGADLIDLKEPSGGALGPVPAAEWPAIRAAIPAVIPASLALGELLDPALPDRLRRAEGFQFAKIGLAGCARRVDWIEHWLAVWNYLPGAVGRVAVAYADAESADSPSPEAVVEAAVEGNCQALLIDTQGKTQGGLLDHLSLMRLTQIVSRARRQRLLVVLAGSLKLEWLNELLSLQVDYVAVRGAVCRGDRLSRLDPQLVSLWCERIRQIQPESAP